MSSKKNTLSIIIPVYNEDLAIASVLEQLAQVEKEVLTATDITEIETIVVNDGSTDETAKIVSGYHRVKLINHPVRLGYGRALKTGFANAKGDLILFIDGDGTYPFKYIPDFYRTLSSNQADVVIGSRFIAEEQNRGPFLRNIGNKLISLLTRIFTKKTVTDAASGMRLFKSHIAKYLYHLPDGMDFIIAMTTQISFLNQKVVEIAIPYQRRIGHSKLKARDLYSFLATLLYIGVLNAPYRIMLPIAMLSLITIFFLILALIKFYATVSLISSYLSNDLTLMSVALAGILSFLFIESVSSSLTKAQGGFISLFKTMTSAFPLVGCVAISVHLYLYIVGKLTTLSWAIILAGIIFIFAGMEIGILYQLLKIMSHRIEKLKIS